MCAELMKPADWIQVQLFSLDQVTDALICRVVLGNETQLLSHDGVLVAIPGVPVLLVGVVVGVATDDQVRLVKGQIKATELPIVVQRIPLILPKLRLRVAEGLRYLIRDVDTVPAVDRQVNQLELTGTVVAKPEIECKHKAQFTAHFDLQTTPKKRVPCLLQGQLNETPYWTVNTLDAGQMVGLTGQLDSYQGTIVVKIMQLDVLATGLSSEVS